MRVCLKKRLLGGQKVLTGLACIGRFFLLVLSKFVGSDLLVLDCGGLVFAFFTDVVLFVQA